MLQIYVYSLRLLKLLLISLNSFDHFFVFLLSITFIFYIDTVIQLRKKLTQTNKDKLSQTSQFNDEVSGFNKKPHCFIMT